MPGLPKRFIKKYGVSKKAWREYRKTLKKGKTNKARQTKTKTRRRTLAKKRRRRSSGLSMSKIFKYLRIFALAAPGIAIGVQAGVTPEQKLKQISYQYTGYDMVTLDWKIGRLMRGWGPFLGVSLATYGIPKITSMIKKIF